METKCLSDEQLFNLHNSVSYFRIFVDTFLSKNNEVTKNFKKTSEKKDKKNKEN